MAAVSAKLVKDLRDKTGAGMMDCKKALTEANGDFEAASEILRKKGHKVAECWTNPANKGGGKGAGKGKGKDRKGYERVWTSDVEEE